MTLATEETFELYIAGLQRSLAGVCVALLLVGGLISVPTSCDCGAGTPHGHSLFVLAGHHHGSDGVTFGRQDGVRNHHLQGSPTVEPQIMGRIKHSADRVVVAVPQFGLAVTSWQLLRFAPYTDTPGPDHIESPDAPPPRNVDHA